MKIKMSKNQWEGIGKKAGWVKESQSEHFTINPREKLVDMIQKINLMKDDFTNITSGLPKENWNLIGEDCDAVVQYLDNAAGRISTVINRAHSKR